MKQTTTLKESNRLLHTATYAAVATAILLVLVKLAAWLWTGSVSILASLVDSMMDSLVSFINMLAVRYSLAPPDAEHRFGHGKAEPLAGLTQAAFLTGSAMFLILQAIERFRFPLAIEDPVIGIAVMIVSIVLTFVLVSLQQRVIRKTSSTAIRADSLHYTSDLLANLGVILALIMASFGWYWADPVFAIGVAVYILNSAVHIGRDAFRQLMDHELPENMQQQIVSLAQQTHGVLGVHDLRTRQSGQNIFIQLHLELDEQLPLLEAHGIAEDVDAKILALMPGAEIIIHQDPVKN
jgi:ferrous-iron efflux pump FieF